MEFYQFLMQEWLLFSSGSWKIIDWLFVLISNAGRGHFAVVKLARHVFTGEKVAVKVIDKTKLDEISRAHLFQEVPILLRLFDSDLILSYLVGSYFWTDPSSSLLLTLFPVI